MTKQKGQVQIKSCDNNGDNLIATLHNVLLVSYLYNGLFPVITLINLGHTCLFHKWFCTVNFGNKEKNVVHLLVYIRDNNNLALNYHADMKYAPLYELLRQASIKTKNQFMAFSYSSWQDCPDTGRSRKICPKVVSRGYPSSC